jgi:hypothetical protein
MQYYKSQIMCHLGWFLKVKHQIFMRLPVSLYKSILISVNDKIPTGLKVGMCGFKPHLIANGPQKAVYVSYRIFAFAWNNQPEYL